MSEAGIEFEVGMTCDGCKGAVTRILNKIEGLTILELDVPTKKLVISGPVDPNDVLAKLDKWAKASGKYVKLVSPVPEVASS